jgi:predicted ATP-dependent endonuclease of OLD family
VSIKSVKIKNLLSFENVTLDNFADLNCIIGQNNTGKSNLLQLLKYYYIKLDNKQALPPRLNSSYSASGSISVTYDLTRLKRITAKHSTNPYFNHIRHTLFSSPNPFLFKNMNNLVQTEKNYPNTEFTLTLIVNSDESVKWLTNNQDKKDIINRVFPFFYVDTRHIDLYDWGKLWGLISQLKFINASGLKREELVNFIDERISERSNSYKDYVNKIADITKTTQYSYQQLVLNYVKVGLEGHTFNIDGELLEYQSDGTNSHKYIELTIHLLVALTRREFIHPMLYIDEPELGLHPKRNEALVERLYDIYDSFKKRKNTFEKGRYQTPNPTILLSTHSPNIVKTVIKLFPFEGEHKVFHFSKSKASSTKVSVMNSVYSDKRFLNCFSDNEARLFFSNFILFVEGATEIELFRNFNLLKKFPKLKLIDVYETDGVALKAISPSFSNLAIPYLVLLDGDDILDINIQPNDALIKIDNSKFDFLSLNKKLGFAFPNSADARQKKVVRQIIAFDNKKITMKKNKADFQSLKLETLFNLINKTLLRHNYYAPSTTIEGSLINVETLPLFKKWLLKVIIRDSKVGGNGEIKKALQSIKKRHASGHCITKIFSALHGDVCQEDTLNSKELYFIKKVRIQFAKHIVEKLNALSLSDNELMIAFRLVFNGKTPTHVSIENSDYKHLSANFIKKVSKMQEFAKDYLPIKTTKTGGWVTSFIDYSILELERKEGKFEDVFKSTFVELSDIIDHVSTSIE